MTFLGGEFKGAQRHWTTYEKGAYAIVRTFDRMYYLLRGTQPLHVFADHKYLLSVLAPPALRPAAHIYVLSKVHRWAIHMSWSNFSIAHMDAPKQVFLDVLKRWAKGYKQKKPNPKALAH